VEIPENMQLNRASDPQFFPQGGRCAAAFCQHYFLEQSGDGSSSATASMNKAVAPLETDQ
jgi:hypothetical protein